MATENTLIVPTNPEDLKQIKKSVDDAVVETIKMEMIKNTIKDIRENMKEQFNIPPTLFNKMVKVSLKENYAQETQKTEEFELLYESVMMESSN